MKKIIFTLLLATSAMLFAKTEEPKVKTEESKVEAVLIAKKNFKDEKAVIKVSRELKQAMNLEGCLAIAFTIINVDPPLGNAMISSCLENYSK
ncbi:hypothetical protein [Chryseobacterium arthrosphaerae]|uniref:hypothetical protein n=1 Tax=Chryseobacterium arthrosphaerae TaxID=651561 RepID=UPI001F4B1F4A|nr:hypothetical protein [Chryseobacterium arthrosphaerae]